jgi:NitT/TauT family transport system substrate-binding protein
MKRIDFTRAVVAGALSAAAGPVAAQTSTPTVIRLGTNASDDITPLLWAQTSGIFARAGLKIDIQKFPSGSIATAAVIGGSLDIARSSLLPLINARSHGIPLELIAAADMSLSDDPTEGIVTLKESPYKTGKDLNGTTMPIPALHDFDEVATRAWVDATGGDSKTIHFIELPQSAVLAALQQGRVAAAFLSNPFLTNAVQSGKAHVIGEPNGAIAKRFLITAYCSTTAFVEKNHDAVRKFIDALQRSGTYARTHHAEVIAAVAPFWGIDPVLLATMRPTRTASALNPKDIQPLLDAALRYGIITKPITAKSMIASGVS